MDTLDSLSTHPTDWMRTWDAEASSKVCHPCGQPRESSHSMMTSGPMQTIWGPRKTKRSPELSYTMRHLFAILALALGLAACDDSSTTAPVTDAIPGPPNAPRLTLTVLTGTKAAPVDSPTVKIAWAYKDSVRIFASAVDINHNPLNPKFDISAERIRGVGDTSIKFWCKGMESASFIALAGDGNNKDAIDSVKVYCK